MKKYNTIFFSMIALVFAGLYILARPKIPILVYHNVKEESLSKPSAINITKEDLETQFEYISQNYKSLSPSELIDYYQGKRNFIGEKPILITFDDGFKSVYKYAFPLAKKYDVKFTVAYLPSGRKPYVTENKISWDQLREMKDSGLIEIASHSFNHFDLSTLSDEEIEYQLEHSKEVIEEEMGCCDHLIVPHGGWDRRVAKIAKEVGYKSLFVTANSINHENIVFNKYKIWRITVSSNDKIEDILDPKEERKRDS